MVAPALGGVVLGYELARQLGVRSLFVEREGGRFALRRGFALERGRRVLLAEDVVTTGLSSRECMACVMAEGAVVVAAACLIDRSGGRADLGVPLVALAELDLPVYPPDRLPPELARQPAVKPGSRPPRDRLTRRRTDRARPAYNASLTLHAPINRALCSDDDIRLPCGNGCADGSGRTSAGAARAPTCSSA